jgi:hypothetical protein
MHWKEGVMVYIKILSQNLPGGNKENDKNLRQNSQFLNQTQYLQNTKKYLVLINK